MGRKQRRKAEERSAGPTSGGGSRWRRVALLAVVAAAVALAVTNWQSEPTSDVTPSGPIPEGSQSTSRTPGPASPPPGSEAEAPARYRPLIGEWVRPDGGYILSVTGVSEDGTATVAYFNPRPINVARAEARQEDDVVGLFVELRDRGYPGSTYTLAYETQTDQLRGLYFQAAQRASYDVVFVRR